MAYERRQWSGGALATTITNAIGASDTSITIAAATNWPTGSGGNFYVVVDFGLTTEEKIKISTLSGSTLTVAARGSDGTTGVSHASGATIFPCHVAQDDDEANQLVNQTFGQASAAKGDLWYVNSPTSPATLSRLAVGSNGALLSAASGVPAYTAGGSSGQIIQSAGSSVPTWQTLANGYGIAGFAATPPVPAVSLTTASGQLSAASQAITVNTPTTILTTSSLGIGTWFVTAGAAVQIADATNTAALVYAGLGTATATLAGCLASPVSGIAAQTGLIYPTALMFLATVTVAGTLTIGIEVNGASGGTVFRDGTYANRVYTNATGYAAVRIA